MLLELRLKILIMSLLSVLISHVVTNTLVFAARPLITDDIGTVEEGKYEFEIGYNLCKFTELIEHSCELSFKHGLTEKMDIGLSLPYQVEPQLTEKLGRCCIALKFQIVKEIFSFSITNELGAPNYSLNGILSHEFGPFISHLNLGYEATGDENTEGTITYSAALEKSLGKTDIVGEISGDKIGFQNYLLGLRYNLNVFILDIAYGNAIRETKEKITIGFHYEF